MSPVRPDHDAELDRLRRKFDPRTGELYRAYLRSGAWAAKRQLRLLVAGNRCEVCNSTNRLDTHHRSYERVGREEVADLVVLCRACHHLFHRRLPS